jgi:hypothetical protein
MLDVALHALHVLQVYKVSHYSTFLTSTYDSSRSKPHLRLSGSHYGSGRGMPVRGTDLLAAEPLDLPCE